MEILTALHILAEGKNSRCGEINFLIEKSYLLASSYIGINHQKIYRLLHKGEYSVNEIAIDAISTLFAQDNDKELTPLAISFKNWKPKIEDENNASFFLNKVVSGRVEQHIFSLFREHDPFFSKILDSVNYLIKSGGYQKTSVGGKSFIVQEESTETYGWFITSDQLQEVPIELLADRKKLLPQLFGYFNNGSGCSVAIPLNDLINRLKHVNFADFLQSDNSVQPQVIFEISEYALIGYNTAVDKLQSTYYKKGKLNEFEVKCIELALKDMSNDLLDGGISSGMHNYLSVYMNELEKEIYLQKYHNILEYLVKVMKTSIAEKIKGSF